MPMPTLPAENSQAWYPHYTALDTQARTQTARATVFQYGGDTIARHQDGGVIAQAATGATNDADIINAAIDAVAATPGTGTYQGGGTVNIADGLYLLGESVVLKFGVNLAGCGAQLDDKNNNGMTGTVLQASGFSGDMIKVGVAASGSRVATNPHHALISGIGLNGVGSAASGVRANDTRLLRMRNFVIRGCTNGIHNTSTLAPDAGSLAHEYVDFFIDDCTGAGILTDGTAGGTDGMIFNGRILSTPKSVRLLNGGGWQIHGLHLTHSAGDPEHMELVTNKALITNCYFDSGTGPVLNASATSWLMATGNLFQMTGAGNAHVRVGTKANISGNVFEWTGSANPTGMIEVGSSSAVGVFCNNWGGPTGAAYVAPVVTPGGVSVTSGTGRSVANNQTY